MSLLWPDTIFAGLFADHCWLQDPRGKVVQCIAPEAVPDGAYGFLSALECMLDNNKKHLRKRTRLALNISDDMSLFSVLPWQDTLGSPAEWERYARLYLAQQGIKLDESWALQTHFRDYGAPGIAYAVRKDWLEQLLGVFRERGLRLLSVLPASAAAYCRSPCAMGKNALILLRERDRLTTLSFQGGHLWNRDAEPVIASEEASGVRLMRRLIATGLSCSEVWEWSPVPMVQRPACLFIADNLPNVKLQRLPPEAWI